MSLTQVIDLLSPWHLQLKLLTGSVVVCFGLKLLLSRRRSSKNIEAEILKDSKYKDGIVYIHMFPRHLTKKVVNLSPYAIKVETWCRMYEIPHQVVETTQFSPKEKHIPWIVYNGEIHADSSLIIELLQKSFDCHDKLTDSEKGVSRTITRMLDDTFAQLYFLYRYSMKPDEFHKYFRTTSVPKFMQYFLLKQIGKSLRKRCIANGIARYGDDHVINLGMKDIQALDAILGDKKYMLGNTVSTVDATVFAHLSQILYPDLSYPWKDYIITECPRLLDYCTRIKEQFWPDWDSLVEHDTFQ